MRIQMENALLIFKVLSGNATAVEELQLKKWITESNDNRLEFEDVKLLFDNMRVVPRTDTLAINSQFDRMKSLVYKRQRRKRSIRLAGLLIATLSGVILAGLLFRYAGSSSETGAVAFHHASLRKVIRFVEKRYGVDIEISDPELARCLVTATFFRATNEKEILSSLENSLEVRFNRVGETRYILTGSACSGAQ